MTRADLEKMVSELMYMDNNGYFFIESGEKIYGAAVDAKELTSMLLEENPTLLKKD